MKGLHNLLQVVNKELNKIEMKVKKETIMFMQPIHTRFSIITSVDKRVSYFQTRTHASS